jgi:hypothetical protein
MSDDNNQRRKRLKSLVDSGIKYNVVNGKRRRQTQRKGLCQAHLTKNKKQQQSTTSSVVSYQSSTHSTTEEFGTIVNNSTNSVTVTENHAKQNTVDGYGELFYFMNSTYLKAFFICHII